MAKPQRAKPKVEEEENIFALVGKRQDSDLPPIVKRNADSQLK